MRTVVLYGRDGLPSVRRRARDAAARPSAPPFELDERDIDADERCCARYLERIPVVAIDGVEVFEFFVDEAELERGSL